MSKLDGHFVITRQAAREIRSSCSEYLGRGGGFDLPSDTVLRDVLDFFTVGHWADFGQKHHFMRKFDGQSPRKAYEENVQWIHDNALKSTESLFGVRKFLNKEHAHKSSQVASHACVRISRLPDTEINAGDMLLAGLSIYAGGRNSQSFGNALHALQDSFSLGHTVRAPGGTEMQPGAIEQIKIYAGEEVEKGKGDEESDHSQHDRQWESDGGKFSLTGRQAVNASKELIFLILNTTRASVSPQITHLIGWEDFKNRWLVASEKLSDKRDFAIDLIEEFHTGVRIGYSNMATINFDEEGLANAMIKELGSNASKVHAVFKRLKAGGYDPTDIKDIAFIYVTKLKTRPSFATAVRNHSALVSLLLKLLDKGPGQGRVSQARRDHISFLKGKNSLSIPIRKITENRLKQP